jgi:hypothetical protein
MSFKNLNDIIKTKDLPVSSKTRSKNTPLMKFVEEKNDWISATEFDNFCKNDKICDWFSVLKNNFIIDDDYKEHPLSFLFKKGCEYEDKIISIIRERTGLLLEKHSTLKTSREYDEKTEKIDRKKVIESMTRGDPIIYSAFLCDRTEYIRGIPDLLVRNDYIHKLFDDIKDIEIQHGSSIFGNYYYIPIEIKFSTVTLDASNKYIANIDRIKFYKTQLFTYCKILNNIQGFLPRYAFIIGKRTITKKNVLDSLSRPGFIDYKTRDNDIVKLFYEGIEWLRTVKSKGINWQMNPELFPNMKIDNPMYMDNKKIIAEEIGEITELWQCGYKNRMIALSKGIESWRDPRLNSDILEINESYKNVVDLIIKVNRDELGEYHPKKFLKTTNDWNIIENEMFVDFETVRDSLDLDSYGEDEWIFLIGVWYKGEYTSFLINNTNDVEEKRIINEFYNFWLSKGSPKIWYWVAEVDMWKRAMKRNNLNLEMRWTDLYQVFREEPFVVKGCKNFKLKSYIRSLLKIGKIDINLPPDDCCNGMDAMIKAWRYYHENLGNLENVLVYNEFDCKSLEILLEFIRNL